MHGKDRMNESPKRVLVTGGTGFVGANLARRLVQDGHEVHLLVRPADTRWRIDSIAEDVRLFEAELQDQERVERVVTHINPQWVFHLASYGAYASQRNVQRIVTTNYNGTVNLVEACLKTEFEAYVGAGSSSEYGYQDHAAGERELPEPNSHYAATKAAATLYCRFTAQDAGRRLATLRLYSVFGPWEDPTRLMPALLLSGLHGSLPPLVSPTIARDDVYVDDAVEAFILTAQSPVEEPGPVFNVGTGTQTSLRQLVELVRNQFRITAEPQWGSMPDRQWDTDVWIADPRTIQAAIGWKPTINLEDGFRRFADWIISDGGVMAHYETCRTPPL